MLKLDIQQFSSEQKKKAGIKLDIQDGSCIGITGEKRSQLMFALIGKEELVGDIILDEISIKKNYKEYMKQISYISAITRKRLDSSKLTVNEFLDLSVMMRMENIDFTDYEEKKKNYLEFFEMKSEEKLINLEEDKLLLLEFITMFLKEPRLILIDDFLSLISKKQVDKIMEFLKIYLYPNNISIIASKYEEVLRRITNEIYVLK